MSLDLDELNIVGNEINVLGNGLTTLAAQK